MAKTNSFKIAELIRGITFDTANDVIVTTKHINSKTCLLYTSPSPRDRG